MGENCKESHVDTEFVLHWQSGLTLLRDLLSLLLKIINIYIHALFHFFSPPPLKSLIGERILITGSANGIGREICLQLANLGATLICWDVDRAKNEILLRDLTQVGAKTFVYEVDVSDRTKVESAASQVKKDIGSITMVINNAGIMPLKSFFAHKPQELEKLFQINVLGQFWILREFLPDMIKRRRGHIVTMCSGTAKISVRNLVPYGASKSATDGIIEGLKLELRSSPEKPDIKFTTVYPLACDTKLLGGVKLFSKFPSLFEFLNPTDVAAALVEGMRRNYEHVYIPANLRLYSYFSSLVLPKAFAVIYDFAETYLERVADPAIESSPT